MYRLLHTTTLLLLSLWVSGQNNHYFIDHARWVYQTEESYEPGQIFMYSGVEENTILGDTILDGALYKKLYKRFIHYNSTKPPFPHQGTTTTSYEKREPTFIRYDSSENKVFYRENVDSSEVVIYNFNAMVGDTIPLSTKYYNGNKVLGIDTISLLGNHHRLYVLDTNIPIQNGIVEGIGGLNGLTFNQPSFPAVSGGLLMTDLVCFEYKDSTYFSPWASHNQIPCPSKSDFISSSKDIFYEQVNIFPNPSIGSFTVQFPENYIGSTFTLYNSNNQIIRTWIIQDKIMTFENIEKGLAFYIIRSSEGKTISGKVMMLD